ncbi:hypothetical protein ADIARSV_4294 [Arcticibacter svalbardensis MN12-7]|uniref:Uncharacterized protein n=1 Tax=Arcticibacter svalbardensis MN12-7 TaxID=1150600 RepID=R9GM04_9SPHI|nr:hypothetical protein ADIARSV_4294 [Arcticibacter svalbardensis MN12-7]
MLFKYDLKEEKREGKADEWPEYSDDLHYMLIKEFIKRQQILFHHPNAPTLQIR